MDQWRIQLTDPGLARIYDDMLDRMDDILTAYLASMAFDRYTHFPQGSLNIKLRASSEFGDEATSIRTLGDVDRLRTSGTYKKLYRTQSFIAMVTVFFDVFESLLVELAINVEHVKPRFKVRPPGRNDVEISTAPLKIANFIARRYEIMPTLVGAEEMLHLNSIISQRNMFVHKKGLFVATYRSGMTNRWAHHKDGDPIGIEDDDFDAYLSNILLQLRGFFTKLDQVRAVVDATTAAAATSP